MSTDALFTPFTINTLTIPNRIAMAPMTRSKSPGGVPGEDVAAYYKRRAEGGVGLIISEGTGIGRPMSLNDVNVPHFYGDAALAGWKRVIDGVHAAGGLMAPQLWHVGSSPPGPQSTGPEGEPESPSGISPAGEKRGRAMSESDIADVIDAFANAALAARRIGFDAIELHGAHAYLIDEFFYEKTNLRTDHWGGATIRARSRFATEVLRACRAAVGPDFPIVIRLSQFKVPEYNAKVARTPVEMEAWLTTLADAGADAFHCSQRRFWEPEFEGSDLNFAGWAKKLTGKPTITVGSVGLSGDFMSAFQGAESHSVGLDDLLLRLERGDFDLVAVGRALLVDPQWAKKVREGRVGEMKDFSPAALATLS